MSTFTCRGLLFDIEGTTSSIRFVHDVMFPFAKRELANYLAEHDGSESLQETAELVAHDAGFSSFRELASARPGETARLVLQQEIDRQMQADLKATGLKRLQGEIWKSGFESGELKAHLYPEVQERLRAWKEQGFVLRVYSSGSIATQKLFFSNTIAGDLLPLFSGHDDTTTGSKKESQSYTSIADKFGFAADQILFFSDVIAELDAAADAGLQTCWSCRPENPPDTNRKGHTPITSFDEIELKLASS